MSEAMSMTEQARDPMILSNILNPGKMSGLDRLALLKMRNALSELRQAHLDLGEYVED